MLLYFFILFITLAVNAGDHASSITSGDEMASTPLTRVGYWVGNESSVYPDRYQSFVSLDSRVRLSDQPLLHAKGHDGTCAQLLHESATSDTKITMWPSFSFVGMLAPEHAIDPAPYAASDANYLLMTFNPKRTMPNFHEEICPVICNNIRHILQNSETPRLFVHSAGNTPCSQLSLKRNGCTDYELQAQEALDDVIRPHLILAGGLTDQEFYFPLSIPGDNPHIQSCFLTVPRDKYTLSDHEENFSGTSYAAPFIVAAASHLQSLFPDLSPLDIRECLLESASRSAVISSSASEECSENRLYIYHVILHDPDDVEMPIDVDALKKSYHDFSIDLETYSSADYGKGFLSLRNAKIYAALMRHNRDESPTSRRKRMFDVLHQKMHWAALKIQRAYKNHRKK